MIKRMGVFMLCLLFLMGAVLPSAAEGTELPPFVHGVDISSWQGDVDFQKVRQSGAQFVILRAGTSYGKDQKFEENYLAAKAAGLEVGCYFYTYATTVEQARKETAQILEWLKGKQMGYPVYLDMEDPSLQKLTNEQRNAICLSFLEDVKAAGWRGGVYANKYWFASLLDLETLKENGEIWWAHWVASGKPDVDYSDYGLWQYASDGRVNGVYGDVDMNVAYVDYPAMMRENGWNGFPKPVIVPQLGDVDMNGKVNSTDARLVLQYFVGSIDESDLHLEWADADGDGNINSTDARLILQYFVGAITEFPKNEESVI